MTESKLKVFDTATPNRYSFHPGHAVIDNAIAEVEARCENNNVALPRGWREIVAALHMDLVKLDPDYRLFQVKEKFGGLRFYADSNVDGFQERIRETEELSYHVCQDTGTDGRLTQIGYWHCTLSPHIEKVLLQSRHETV